MIVVGPHEKTGIGQHAMKYVKLFLPNGEYYQLGQKLPETDNGLIFVIPTRDQIEYIKYAKTRVKNLACMTVCETETVHEDYGLIMKEFKRVAVPSEFCKRDTFLNQRKSLIPSTTLEISWILERSSKTFFRLLCD